MLRWNRNVDVEFVGRHLLSRVDSEKPDYIRQKIREQLKGSSVTVVLIGRDTCKSEWVQFEVEESLAANKGVLGICLEEGVTVPDSLIDCGAEVIPWNPASFGEAIERAALGAGRAAAIAAGVGAGGSCSR